MDGLESKEVVRHFVVIRCDFSPMVYDWCLRHIGQRGEAWVATWVRQEEYEFSFKEEKDLTLFSLKWI